MVTIRISRPGWKLLASGPPAHSVGAERRGFVPGRVGFPKRLICLGPRIVENERRATRLKHRWVVSRPVP
jgi:hypothetical protein